MSTLDTVAARAAPRSPARRPPPLLKLALRELRGGLRGFYVFIGCVALGVLVITAVSTLSDALKNGMERQGAQILGGDVAVSRMHLRATDAERRWLDAMGRVSETATARTMARRPDGADQALVELKAVDAAYPLVGAVKLSGGSPLAAALAGDGAAVEPMLLERLGLKLGDTLNLGRAQLTVRATVQAEPDQLADRLTYGPRVFISLATLEKTGVVQPGSLVRWRYAASLADAPRRDIATALTSFRDRLKADHPEAGFTVVDRRDPSPQVSRTLERLRQFLTLLGLTALLVGGVGVANAVATFIDRRRKVIATMKSLGATNRFVLSLSLVQVMLMAALGVVIGLAGGLVVPVVLNALYGDALPIRAEFAVTPGTIATAVGYGFLVALLFTLWPLGRAELIPPAVLFRDDVESRRRWPKPAIVAMTVAIAALLAAFAVLSADSRRIAFFFCAGVVVVFAVFYAFGILIGWLARRSPRPRRPELALALRNIGAPDGLTRSVVLSLGAGLSLLVAVALSNASLVAELTSRVPEQSPDYFVLDIPRDDYPAIAGLVERMVPGSRMEEAPMLRGRLVALNGTPVEQIKATAEAAWVLTGDRGLSYADKVPEGSTVKQGEWWAPGYAGEPLVSFEIDLARKLGLKLGDTVTVNVLGRNITARISNLREVNWESLAINFVMVFSPNTLKSAPHNLLATISLPKGSSMADEAAVSRALGREFPAVSAIRVKDAIAAFNRIFDKVMIAVRVAGGVTLAAGALVLAGALATAQRRRILEAVILKTLGATRRRIIAAHAAEYLLLAASVALLAVLLGAASAWAALTQVMDVPFTFSLAAVLQALATATGLVLLFGAVGTWAVLRARPVPYLRSE